MIHHLIRIFRAIVQSDDGFFLFSFLSTLTDYFFRELFSAPVISQSGSFSSFLTVTIIVR